MAEGTISHYQLLRRPVDNTLLDGGHLPPLQQKVIGVTLVGQAPPS